MSLCIFYNYLPACQSISLFTSFMLAMTRYPEVFKKAQEEMDRVVGQDRLPDIEDRDSLPYLEAVLKELLRYISLM